MTRKQHPIFYLDNQNISSPPSLKRPRPILLIDMSIPLLLLAILQDDCDHEYDDDVETDHSKSAGEDNVEEVVGVGGEGFDAADFCGGDLGVKADCVLDEGGRG
jgi:hypothetical protein